MQCAENRNLSTKRPRVLPPLIGPPGIVLDAMHFRVVLNRFKMRSHFGRHIQIDREPLFNLRRQAVGLAQPHVVWKQKMDLDDLPVARGAKAHSVVFESELGA